MDLFFVGNTQRIYVTYTDIPNHINIPNRNSYGHHPLKRFVRSVISTSDGYNIVTLIRNFMKKNVPSVLLKMSIYI